MASRAEDFGRCFEGVALEQNLAVFVDGSVCLDSYVGFRIGGRALGGVRSQFLDSDGGSRRSRRLFFAMCLHQEIGNDVVKHIIEDRMCLAIDIVASVSRIAQQHWRPVTSHERQRASGFFFPA